MEISKDERRMIRDKFKTGEGMEIFGEALGKCINEHFEYYLSLTPNSVGKEGMKSVTDRIIRQVTLAVEIACDKPIEDSEDVEDDSSIISRFDLLDL